MVFSTMLMKVFLMVFAATASAEGNGVCATTDSCATTDDSSTLMQTRVGISSESSALRAELAKMKTMALIQRTAGLDIDEDAFKGAINADDSKAALIELIVGHQVLTPKEATIQYCDQGILSGNDVCCAASCGKCGGTDCDKRPGGGSKCCTGSIKASGIICKDETDTVCNLPAPVVACSVQGYCSAGNNLNSKGAPVGPYTEGGWVTTATCIDTLHAPAGCHYEVATSLDGKGTKYTYTESAAMGANGGPGWDKVRSIRVFKAGSSPPAPGPSSPAPRCGCQEICGIYGDPHYVTFDGKHQAFQAKRRSEGEALNRHWAVHSEDVQIQGLAVGDVSWSVGIAVSGNFIGGHKLIFAEDQKDEGRGRGKGLKVLWDGSEVLTTDGALHPAPGVELYRNQGKSYVPTSADIAEIEPDEDKQKYIMKRLTSWGAHPVYNFRLPQNVEIFVTWRDAVEVLIIMPAQAQQGGWCGNFNDNADDEDKASHMGPLDASEDLFKESGIASLLEQNKIAAAPVRKDQECPEQTLQKAQSACSHIAEQDIKDDCIGDICLTDDATQAAAAAENMEILEVLVGKGIPQFTGHGLCLDQTGVSFSSYEAKAVAKKAPCVSLLRRLSSFAGVRGAQLTDGSTCKILVDAGTDLLPQKIPGGWGAVAAGQGEGIVGSSTSDSGSYCWKVL